jgi:hypothetical protein
MGPELKEEERQQEQRTAQELELAGGSSWLRRWRRR